MMKKNEPKTCVLIADGARARFFDLRRPEDEDYDAGPRLRERESLVHPEGKLTGTELFANTKSGRHRSPQSGASHGAGPAHGLDDHRSRHEAENERRFAKRVAETAATIVGGSSIRRLVVVAAPSMLGSLRGPLGTQLPKDLKVEEIPRDVSWHALPNVEELLEQRGILGPRVVPETVFRPAGQPPPRL